MTKKPETIDCVAVKQRAQRQLAKALAGKTPAEQAETLRRLAATTPLWQRFAKPRAKRPLQAVRTRRARRSVG